jgi:hypothetical protein
MVDTTKSLSRKEIRAKLLGDKHSPKSKLISLWGIDIELRQASLKDILQAQQTDDDVANAVRMIIRYAYVPGTDERVFEEADRDTILGWPFGQELVDLQMAIAELTGVDISKAEEELKENPLKDS